MAYGFANCAVLGVSIHAVLIKRNYNVILGFDRLAVFSNVPGDKLRLPFCSGGVAKIIVVYQGWSLLQA